MRVVVLALLGLPLAGCFGVTLPPPPLPDWAMSPQAEPAAADRARTARRAPSHRRTPNQNASASYAIPASGPQADVLPFSTEWQAREEALDAHLRRTMNICRGC